MRVVAGELRGRRIQPPPDERARPTTDRVREAVFNALASRGLPEGARVLDLFAGTGALGIEALSRGATRVEFVESDRRMLAVLRANVADLGLGDRARVHALAADDALAVLAEDGDRFDLALLDPPYDFGGWRDLLARLPADLAVAEHDGGLDLPAGWHVVREKRYGGTLVTFAERDAPRPE